MDVKRVENTVIPTAAVAAGAGLVGYAIPKMVTSDGQMSNAFKSYNAANMLANDVFMLREAEVLDTINPFITDEEAKSLAGNRKKFLEFVQKKMETANKDLESFVTYHADSLGIQPKDGQRMKDAVKEFLKDKDAQAVKELFLPDAMRAGIDEYLMEPSKYVKTVEETFGEVFDSAKKSFKKDADKETVEFFKKSLRNMKMANAKFYALVGGAFALAGAALANLMDANNHS